MNCNQVDFIICSNNTQFYEECVRYIGDLEIPEGYNIDVLCIQEADSMASGYNAGMQASDAKYKVYLHQDTFILNKKFLHDVIEIFQQDETIGMLGVIGAKKLPADANCYLHWNTGNIDAYNGRTIVEGECFQSPERAYIEVSAIDGLIMVTQYDVCWREDILDGWDFYDVSQSLEMQKRGYKVVVPYQETAWCYHDCGVSKLKAYDKYRKKMFQEYPGIFSGEIDEEKGIEDEKNALQLEDIRNNLIRLLEQDEYEQLCEITEEIRYIWPLDTQTREIANIMEVYDMEARSTTKEHSDLFQCSTWAEMYEYYREIRFTLMRIENCREDERIKELKSKVEQGEISRDLIRKIANNTLKCSSKVYECLLKEKKDLPLVSVIVTVYNGENIVGETLESILKQTYRNLEVIVVDDASTDRSREIISSFEDTRIKKVFLEKNRHVCYAGNVGFQMAKGKYVALIGHDDLWKADKLEKQVSFMEEHPSYTVCFTWVDIIDEDKKVVNDRWAGLYNMFCGDNHSQYFWMRQLILGGNQFCAPSACIRREFLEHTGFYRYGLVQLQDYDLWLRLMNEGPVYILQEKLVLYRRFVKNGNNLSSINRQTQNRDSHEKQWIQDTFINKVPEKDFARVFKQDMIHPQARDEKEITCEKVLFLWRMRNVFFVKRFIELLEDEECRDILETKYQFSLTDFYKINAEAILYDNALLESMQEQQRLIEYYQQMQS